MTGPIAVDVSADRGTTRVAIPFKGNGTDSTSLRALHELRDTVLPATIGTLPNATYAVTGPTAASADENSLLKHSAPLVFGFVLTLAFILLLVSFRSIVIAAKAIVLNLMSVAAAYGVLVIIFQWGWGESLLNFRSNGGIASWLPIFLFVILFGLSMDYHVFILSRIREAFDRGHEDGGRGRARDQDHRRHGHERRGRDGRRLLDLRDAPDPRHEGARHRAGRGGPHRRHHRPGGTPPSRHEAAGRLELVPPELARLAASPRPRRRPHPGHADSRGRIGGTPGSSSARVTTGAAERAAPVSIGTMQTLRRTPLYERHLAAGARLVPFAGWEMPVQYEGVIAEHKAVRNDAGVFDVSHMGEIEIEGPTAAELLQGVLSNDISRLEEGDAQYTLLTNEAGGIIDDLIVYRMGPHRYLLVVNAANRAVDVEWLRELEIAGSEVRDVSDEYALLAVQGPNALDRIGIEHGPAFTWEPGDVGGIEVMVNRTGYTGEEGVELACAPGDAPALWDAILAAGVTPCGLGARDTLRLEVCYPLHGNDIGPQWDAISSGLGWVCALDTEFTGAPSLREVKERGPENKLVAFRMTEQAIPRPGMTIEGGGEVTSGSLSPMLDQGIGLGYVPTPMAAPGSELTVDVRGRLRHGEVTTKPIYKREEQ